LNSFTRKIVLTVAMAVMRGGAGGGAALAASGSATASVTTTGSTTRIVSITSANKVPRCYQSGRQRAGLQAGGEGGRTSVRSDGAVLLLDVVAQGTGGRAAYRPGEVRR
jgi:hypothetical protein